MLKNLKHVIRFVHGKDHDEDSGVAYSSSPVAINIEHGKEKGHQNNFQCHGKIIEPCKPRDDTDQESKCNTEHHPIALVYNGAWCICKTYTHGAERNGKSFFKIPKAGSNQ